MLTDEQESKVEKILKIVRCWRYEQWIPVGWFYRTTREMVEEIGGIDESKYRDLFRSLWEIPLGSDYKDILSREKFRKIYNLIDEKIPPTQDILNKTKEDKTFDYFHHIYVTTNLFKVV